MIRAALSGEVDSVHYHKDPIFNLDVPDTCPGVPVEVLQPRGTWSDPAAYDDQARKLAAMFRGNFAAFADAVSEDVRRAGPNP
jgi:phosphoenolpyruvate carboxykinase (ATP)